MKAHYEPTLFLRHNRPLHAIWLESQAWFCVRELGRLMGRYLDDHIVCKLDEDQHKVVSLLRYGDYQEITIVSESGAYTLFAHHYIPENRSLRRWLTHQVVAVLRDRRRRSNSAPNIDHVEWSGRHVSLLHWQNESWIMLRDMPSLVSKPRARGLPLQFGKSCSWQRIARRLLRW